MTIPYFQVDAFVGANALGNAAGVCLLADWLDDSVMQAMAAEHNQTETAFLVRSGDGYQLRWFTPTVEVDLCGHATLASGHVLFNHFGDRRSAIPFETRSGTVSVARHGDLLTLDFPALVGKDCDPPTELIQGLGARPSRTAVAMDYHAVYENEAEIRRLQPNMSMLETLKTRGVIATAPGDKHDYVLRFFAPAAGVPEDSATGSAQSMLAPYWAKRLGRPKLSARQLSKRGAEFLCETTGDRVLISGRAVTYLTGFVAPRFG